MEIETAPNGKRKPIVNDEISASDSNANANATDELKEGTPDAVNVCDNNNSCDKTNNQPGSGSSSSSATCPNSESQKPVKRKQQRASPACATTKVRRKRSAPQSKDNTSNLKSVPVPVPETPTTVAASANGKTKHSAPTRKVYRGQALVVQHVRSLFDKQALLWKHHAVAMEQAAASMTTTPNPTRTAQPSKSIPTNQDVACLVNQPPWNQLVGNRFLMGTNDCTTITMPADSVTPAGTGAREIIPCFALGEKLQEDLNRLDHRIYERQQNPSVHNNRSSSKDNRDKNHNINRERNEDS